MKTAGRIRKSESGQTIAIVAVLLVALFGFAALAIDVSALYVARHEAQKAADAAALAGASVFATSSFASMPASFTNPAQICTTGGPGSTAAVNREAEAAAHENSIANQPATVSNITCTLFTGDPDRNQNPQVTVTVRQTNLQTFFSRIWSSSATSVTATATAEAYNSSGRDVPVQMTGAKPWLLANCDENSKAAPQSAFCTGGYRTFINADGTLTDNGSYIGNIVSLTKMDPAASPTKNPTADNFYGLDFSTPAQACPSGGGCALDGDYKDDIQCTSPVTLQCGDVVGGGGASVTIRPTNNPNRTRQATQCLIHSGGDDLRIDGQDIFHSPTSGLLNVPIRIEGGTSNPNPSLRGNQNVSRSDSIVTVPVYDGHKLCASPGNCNTPATIVGFMQLGIVRTCGVGSTCTNGSSTDPNSCKCTLSGAGAPTIQAVIVNAVGCKPGTPTGGVASTKTSPISVRLIHQ